MAKVKKTGKSYAVVHGRTGQVLKRFRGRGAKARAMAAKRAMHRRMGR